MKFRVKYLKILTQNFQAYFLEAGGEAIKEILRKIFI